METVKESEALLPSQRDSDWVADYAVRRGMPKWSIDKYRKGNGDKEQLVQLVTRVRVELEAEFATKIATLEHANSFQSEALDKLQTQNANQAINISNLCSQMENIKGQNAAKQSEISILTKALNAIRGRALGSIFGKGKDIIKLVDDATTTQADH